MRRCPPAYSPGRVVWRAWTRIPLGAARCCSCQSLLVRWHVVTNRERGRWSSSHRVRRLPPASSSLCNQRNMSFLPTSAKTGDNVEEAFVTLARRILQAGQARPGVSGSRSVRLAVSQTPGGGRRVNALTRTQWPVSVQAVHLEEDVACSRSIIVSICDIPSSVVYQAPACRSISWLPFLHEERLATNGPVPQPVYGAQRGLAVSHLLSKI